MNYLSWLKKDITVPTRGKIINLFFLISLPNIFFLMLAWYSFTSRPLMNIDYIFSLFVICLPWRITRFLGGIIFILAMFFDVLMFVIQIFPFMDFAAIKYLSSFLLTAPTNYIVLFLFLFLCILVILYLTFLFSKVDKIERSYSLFVLLGLFVICYVFMSLGVNYMRFYGILGRDNYYISHSQVVLYHDITKSDFWNDANVTPRLLPIKADQKRGVNYLTTPTSNKILFIVAESWGVLRNQDAQDMVIKNILDRKSSFEFINYGSFQASGATVSGELRELCGLRLGNNGFALSRTEKSQFSNCLPRQLQKQGYETKALHGTSGLLYDRTAWYPKAGFQEVFFGENFIGLPRCIAFKGICDSALMDVVGNQFKNLDDKKLFFYWMTLTSHQPYSQKDIHNSRFDCSHFGMNSKGDACHNAQLETQFLDNLAELTRKPEMHGVEVMVVGDHQPPIWGEDIKYIQPLKVSYLHFKIK